eukprot:181726_1
MSTCALIIAVVAASMGNLLEWFDFAMFGLLADEIGANFFPNSNPGIEVLNSFALFAGAFFMRPIGGILFGYIGDKYGRITSLRISLFMMAIPTFLTGCLPNYNAIGILSPLLLTVFRLIQGLSVGGEFTGAITYILEVSPVHRKAFYNTLVGVTGCGTLLGTILIGVLREIFTQQQMEQFVWRIPFLVGVVVAGIGVWMRTGMQRSQEFMDKKLKGETLDNPVKEVLMNHKLTMLSIVLHIGYGAAAYYLLFIWMPEYAHGKAINPVHSMYLINGINMSIGLVVSVISGWIVDRYFNSNPVFTLITFGTISSVYTLLVMPFLSETTTVQVLFMQMFWAISTGFYQGGWSLWGIERFKDATVIRYSGFGFAYNIALALFGGTAPLLSSALLLKYDTWTLGVMMFVYG